LHSLKVQKRTRQYDAEFMAMNDRIVSEGLAEDPCAQGPFEQCPIAQGPFEQDSIA